MQGWLKAVPLQDQEFMSGGGGGNKPDFVYSLNVQEWKNTLLGVILGITSFGVEIHSQTSDSNQRLWSGFYDFESGFPLQTKWSLI